MTAPTDSRIEAVEPPIVDGPEVDGEVPLYFPVIVIEGLDTSDGRYLAPDGLQQRALPITLLGQTKSAHGGDPPPAAETIGRIDTLTRTPGPDVISQRTGQPFPEGTYVWSGTGSMSTTKEIDGDNVYDFVRRRFLRGISVDLAGLDAELIGGDGLAVDPDNPRREMVAHSAEIAAVTLVPIAAFGDAYVTLSAGEGMAEPITPEELPDSLAASAFPAWRSVEVGDLVRYPEGLIAAGAEPHTGGMIALVPADPAALAVDGGDPADELHLTLVYLGEDVTGWPPENRDALLNEMAELLGGNNEDSLREVGPIEARIMGHAQFNPDGGPDGDREPCAVYLIGDAPGVSNLHRIIRGIVEHKEGVPEQHDPLIAHITAGYNLPLDVLSFTGPVVFDRLRVALGDQVTDYPLGGEPATQEPAADVQLVAAGPTAAERRESKDKGNTLDGSFPIDNGDDLDNAIQAVGRAKDVEAARRHIIGRAKELGMDNRIPEHWKTDGTTSDGSHAAAGPVLLADEPGDLPDPTAEQEVGMPDAPQPCQLGDDGEHPAVRSLLYAGGEKYVPTCVEHEAEARVLIEDENDEEPVRVVEIEQGDAPADEQEETL